VSYFRPHNNLKTVVTTSNLCRIIQFRPQNFKEATYQMKAFALHPSVNQFYLGGIIACGFFYGSIGAYSPAVIAASDTIHRDVVRENYKRVHGHYHE